MLTHQANIDSTWERCLVPAILKHCPGQTPEELADAKVYTYGGAIIQDIGYYPFGSVLFTNLTHYVRSGDFVRNLLDAARDRNDFAFALGSLAHYEADLNAHPKAEKLFRDSLRKTMAAYCAEIARQPAETAAAPLKLANGDFDTGRPTRAGEYPLADETYGEWLHKLADKKFENLNSVARQNILAFYGTQPKTSDSKEEKEQHEQADT